MSCNSLFLNLKQNNKLKVQSTIHERFQLNQGEDENSCPTLGETYTCASRKCDFCLYSLIQFFEIRFINYVIIYAQNELSILKIFLGNHALDRPDQNQLMPVKLVLLQRQTNPVHTCLVQTYVHNKNINMTRRSNKQRAVALVLIQAGDSGITMCSHLVFLLVNCQR